MTEKLKRLYPRLSADELEIAKESLDEYLLLAWEILEEDSHGTTGNQAVTPSARMPSLTGAKTSPKIQAKVDSPQIN
jgi:hypothetical protein